MPKRSRIIALSLGSLATIGMVPIAHRDLRPTSSISEASAHDFDFMLGSWTFVADSKNPSNPPRFRGRWTAERSGDNTLIEDDYRAVNDSGEVTYKGRTYRPGETIYLGVTYRAFDARTKRWTTAFVQPPRATWSLGTAWRDAEVIREAPADTSPSTRARFYNIGPNHFTWSFDVTRDGGKTWTTDVVHVEATRVGTSTAAR
jgi:hypothetical protein